MDNIFYISLLEQDITSKKQVDWANQVLPKSKKELKFEVEDNKKSEPIAIIDNMVYDQQAKDQMPGFHYLILGKSYSEKDNT